MDMQSYELKLSDPRWIQRRKEIIHLDKGRCRKCLRMNDLQVHHLGYIEGLDPWQYTDDFLITLCKICHEEEERYKRLIKGIVRDMSLTGIPHKEIYLHLECLKNDSVMALTDQPYLPLFVDDWMNNNKLKMCEAKSHGVMIAIMCIMHKEPKYGEILLKQKFKQNEEQIVNFANHIAQLTSFGLHEIVPALTELISEKVLKIEGDYLICDRMVRDGEISLKRATAGAEGGKKTHEKPTDAALKFAKAKSLANTGIGIGIGNKINIEFDLFWNLYDKKVGEKGKLIKKWENLNSVEREKIMAYIPAYKLAQPDKKFRKDPATFLNNKSWNDELIYSKNINNGTAHRNGTEQPTPVPGIVTERGSRNF